MVGVGAFYVPGGRGIQESRLFFSLFLAFLAHLRKIRGWCKIAGLGGIWVDCVVRMVKIDVRMGLYWVGDALLVF